MMNEEQSKQIIESNYDESKEIIKDKDKVEELIKKVEEKIKNFPGIGDTLADLITMIDLVRMYFLKEYREEYFMNPDFEEDDELPFN